MLNFEKFNSLILLSFLSKAFDTFKDDSKGEYHCRKNLSNSQIHRLSNTLVNSSVIFGTKS